MRTQTVKKLLATTILATTLTACSSGQKGSFDKLKQDLYKETPTASTNISPTSTSAPVQIEDDTTEKLSKLSKDEIINDIITDSTFTVLSSNTNGVITVYTILCKFPYDVPEFPKNISDVFDKLKVDLVYIKRNPQGEIISGGAASDMLELNRFNLGLYQYSLYRVIFPSNYLKDNIKARITIDGKEHIIDKDFQQGKASDLKIDFLKYGVFRPNYEFYLFGGLAQIVNSDYYNFYFYNLSSGYRVSGDVNINLSNYQVIIETTDGTKIEGVVGDDPSSKFGGFIVQFNIPFNYKDDINNNIFKMYCTKDESATISVIFDNLPKDDKK